MEGKRIYPLIGIFLFVLAVRLYLALQAPAFAYEGYAVLRQVDEIAARFWPLYDDPLSYGGRTLVFSPLFSYLLALFARFFPLWWVAKIVPNVFAAVVAIFVYLLLEKVTRHRGVAAFTALVAGLFPLSLVMTTSTLSPHTLALPYLLACLYCFLHVRDEHELMPTLLVMIILYPFIHPSALFLVGGLLFYGLLCHAEGLLPKKTEVELFLFSSLYMVWVVFLLFKKAFLVHGFNVIWQNVPTTILEQYFEPISLLSSFAAIGILPALFGTYVVYKYMFSKGEHYWYLFVGFAFFFFALVSMKLIEPKVGLLYLGTFLFLLCGQFFAWALDYVDKTKFAEQKNAMVAVFLLVFVFSLFIFPRQETDVPSLAQVEALVWLREHTAPQETVLGALELGHPIASIAERPNVWDSSFLLIGAIDQRANDVADIFQTSSEVTAVKLLNKYGATYLVLDALARKHYRVSDLAFVHDAQCFSKVYEKDDVTVYKVLCGVREL